MSWGTVTIHTLKRIYWHCNSTQVWQFSQPCVCGGSHLMSEWSKSVACAELPDFAQKLPRTLGCFSWIACFGKTLLRLSFRSFVTSQPLFAQESPAGFLADFSLSCRVWNFTVDGKLKPFNVNSNQWSWGYVHLSWSGFSIQLIHSKRQTFCHWDICLRLWVFHWK